MTLIGIFGRLGSGKTLFASILSTDYYAKGYKIYANYKLQNALPLTFNYFLEFNKNYNPDNKYLFILDEVYAFGLESRASASKLNRLSSYIVLQSRKMNIDIIYTTQLLNAVDLRLKDLTDIVIRASKTESYYKFIILSADTYRTVILPMEKAKKYYGLYNTREIINPVY